MYGDILRGIIGIEIFPVLSLVIFVTFFTGVLVRVARMTRPQIEHLSRLPLADDAGDQEASR
jgi:cytochrome c oxidase cbb3-type subunit 4